jgi:vacuolar-type H+-ATPase subunit I/STV1
MLRSHELTITHILFMDEGQVIKKELEERFGNFNSARNAYKETYGITAGGWDKLVAKVQNLPIPIPIPIKERVQTLEDTVKSLSETLQKLEKNERVKTLENTVKVLSETLQKLEESVNVLSETLRQSLDRGGIMQESGKTVKKISSYEEFKEIVLEAYQRLDNEYNYAGVVPIYAIRRDIGDRVSRSQFSEWMFQLRQEKTLYFYVCQDLPTSEDQLRDSIQDSSISTLYFFVEKP